MKKIGTLILMAMLSVFLFCGCVEEAADKKPVIYLYPTEKTQVSVTLDYDGKLTTTYPTYNNGWNVTAYPDGTLLDSTGREYYCLFWEGVRKVEYNFDQGFCVKGSETRAFLENALDKLGLTDKEANEFMIYWLPQMEENPYNVIAFQQEAYTQNAKLNISPAPDSILRVFMAYKAADKPVDIAPQELAEFNRVGFTVVEWGGCEVK